MVKEILAFAVGFAMSQAFSAMRISQLKSKVDVYERYVRERLDEAADRLKSSLNSR